MPNLNFFRTATQGAPQTARSLSARVTKRQTTTAVVPIRGSASRTVVNIGGYSTLRGTARQGVTQTVTGLKRTAAGARTTSSAGSAVVRKTPVYRAMGGLFR